jgi:hypothetical protein
MPTFTRPDPADLEITRRIDALEVVVKCLQHGLRSLRELSLCPAAPASLSEPPGDLLYFPLRDEFVDGLYVVTEEAPAPAVAIEAAPEAAPEAPTEAVVFGPHPESFYSPDAPAPEAEAVGTPEASPEAACDSPVIVMGGAWASWKRIAMVGSQEPEPGQGGRRPRRARGKGAPPRATRRPDREADA